MKTTGILMLGLIIGAGGLYVLQNVNWDQWTNRWGAPQRDTQTNEEAVQVIEDTDSKEQTTQGKVQAVDVEPYPGIEWEITEIGVDALGIPVTSVNVKTEGNTYLMGNFSGDCFDIAGSGWSLATENQVSGVICWWAGGGTEIGVFKEGDRYIAKVGDIDEGSAEVPGARGDFETLFEIELK